MRLLPKLLGPVGVVFAVTASAAAPGGGAPSSDVSLSTLVSYGPPSSASSAQGLDVTATPDEIDHDNVLAVTAIYYSALLEEMKLFSVVDKIVEQFESGLLPITRSAATDPLDRYWKAKGERLDASTRARIYRHALGTSGSQAGQPNQELNALWARFIEAASAFEAQISAQAKLKTPAAVSQAGLRGAARDLALNLSNHAYGGVHFAARRLAQHVKDAEAVLSSPPLLAHYGVQTSWQVVEKVAAKEFGGAPNVASLRAQAAAGSRLLRWLAKSSKQLESSTATLPALPAGDADLWKKVAGASWKGKPAPPKGKPVVVALCFDAKLTVVGCKVVVKKK